jgi:hypothetical protein
MKVSIKQLDVKTELKKKGMELSVYDEDNVHLGDLFINGAKVIWCKGKSTPKSGGIELSWSAFIKAMEKK